MNQQLNLSSLRTLCIGAVLASTACVVDDADRESAAIQSFEGAPADTQVSVYEVEVAGAAELQYLAEEPAKVEIFVNGVSQYAESFDASTSTHVDYSATVPLSRQGPNEVQVTIAYDGDEQTITSVVTVAEPDPTVTFPDWSTAYNQTQEVTVTTPAAWSVDLVEYSVDGGRWMEAELDEEDGYSVVLTELDIGDNALALRVESSNLGHSQTDLYYDTIAGIVPVFDCDSPGDSVLPSEDMIYDNGTEVRTMLGYFGDPAGGHTVTFMFDFVDERDDEFEDVASIVNYGRYSITAEFNVRSAWCDAINGDCRVPYGLTVWVDGTELCSNADFGDITNYDRFP